MFEPGVQTHENLEHLAMMEAVLGPVPEHMARHANRGSAKYFTHRNRLNWPAGAASRKSVRAVQKMRDLRDIIQSGCDASVKPHIDTLVRLDKHNCVSITRASFCPQKGGCCVNGWRLLLASWSRMLFAELRHYAASPC